MKLMITCIASLLLVGTIEAQTIAYQPLHGNYTQYIYRSQSWSGGQPADNYFKTIWSGDTSIGGENYVRVFQNGLYYGGIREDVPNQQRYFIDRNDVEKNITIDPFLSVGDVLSDSAAFLNAFRVYNDLGPGYYDMFDTLVVDQVDSIMEVGGTYSTNYHLRKLPYPVSFIYNSYRGLQRFQVLEFNTDQLCYREDGEQTPPGQETPWTFMCDLGMNETNLLQVQLHPNPTVDYMNLSGDLSLVTDLSIFDSRGALIQQIPVSDISKAIALKDLKSGVYFLSLNRNTQVLRFQKM